MRCPVPTTVNLPKGTFELKKPRSDTPRNRGGRSRPARDAVAITGRIEEEDDHRADRPRPRDSARLRPPGAFLRDLTITGGDLRQEFHGGGILLEEHPLLVEDAIVKENTFTMQTNTFGLGGGIAALDGDLTLDNATVTKNRAHGDFVDRQRGGRRSLPSLRRDRDHRELEDPQEPRDDDRIRDTEGGGLYLQGPTTMVNTTVAQNRADLGGGIHTDSSAGLDAEATTLSGNRARHGAGISVESNDAVEFINSTFSGNELVPDTEDELGTGSAVYIGKRGFVRLPTRPSQRTWRGQARRRSRSRISSHPRETCRWTSSGRFSTTARRSVRASPLIDEVHLNVLGDASCTAAGSAPTSSPTPS